MKFSQNRPFINLNEISSYLFEESWFVIVIDKISSSVFDLDNSCIRFDVLCHDLDVKQNWKRESFGEWQVGGRAGYLEQLGKRTTEANGAIEQNGDITELIGVDVAPVNQVDVTNLVHDGYDESPRETLGWIVHTNEAVRLTRAVLTLPRLPSSFERLFQLLLQTLERLFQLFVVLNAEEQIGRRYLRHVYAAAGAHLLTVRGQSLRGSLERKQTVVLAQARLICLKDNQLQLPKQRIENNQWTKRREKQNYFQLEKTQSSPSWKEGTSYLWLTTTRIV